MLTTKRKPVSVGEFLTEEFMKPMGLTQAALAEAMWVQRKRIARARPLKAGVKPLSATQPPTARTGERDPKFEDILPVKGSMVD